MTWRYQINLAPLQVRGITIFIVDEANQIETAYYELNSGALLYNLGRPECNANWTVSVQLFDAQPRLCCLALRGPAQTISGAISQYIYNILIIFLTFRAGRDTNHRFYSIFVQSDTSNKQGF